MTRTEELAPVFQEGELLYRIGEAETVPWSEVADPEHCRQAGLDVTAAALAFTGYGYGALFADPPAPAALAFRKVLERMEEGGSG